MGEPIYGTIPTIEGFIVTGNKEIQVQQLCKYQLPCGKCDKTGEICSYIGGKK